MVRFAAVSIALIFILTCTFPVFAGEEMSAADRALEKINALPGFTVTYRGQSATSETRPEIYIGYAQPDQLFIRVPAMDFYGSHADSLIRIQSQGSGVLMPLADVRKLNVEAQSGFAKLDWLSIPDPHTQKMEPQLSFDLGKGTLNVGISFGEGHDRFSWIALMRSKEVKLIETDVHWKLSFPVSATEQYTYLVSKKNGILEKMVHYKDGKPNRTLEMVDLRLEAPDEATFTEVFSDSVKPEPFADSPSQKSQYLIGLYDGYQRALIADLIPRWSAMDLDGRIAVANAVAAYWTVVYKNIFESQKKSLEKAMASKELLDKVREVAADKTEYEKFVTSLPPEKAVGAKKMWQEKVLGMVGFELLDPFAGWTRSRFITPAQEMIEELGQKQSLEKKERDKMLGTIALPVIDSCYTAAEPVVLPKLIPMIQKATAGLE